MKKNKNHAADFVAALANCYNPSGDGKILLASYAQTHSILPLLPIAYKIAGGNKLEILPNLIPNRVKDIWGFEIAPDIVLAKNYRSASWDNHYNQAKSMELNGKKGSLSSLEYLLQIWNEQLRDKIIAMDDFLCTNDADSANTNEFHKSNIKSLGIAWCSKDDGDLANCLHIYRGWSATVNKCNMTNYDRLIIKF